MVEFPDGSQAGGICFVDTSVTKPNAAYLRLYDGTDACGVTAGEDYREAGNRRRAALAPEGPHLRLRRGLESQKAHPYRGSPRRLVQRLRLPDGERSDEAAR